MKPGDICKCKGCFSASPSPGVLCRCTVRLEKENLHYKTWEVLILKKNYSSRLIGVVGRRPLINHCVPQTLNLILLSIEELLEI